MIWTSFGPLLYSSATHVAEENNVSFATCLATSKVAQADFIRVGGGGMILINPNPILNVIKAKKKYLSSEEKK